MGMEGPQSQEDLETLKQRIIEDFRLNGPTNDQENLIQQCIDRMREEGRKPGQTVEQRIRIELEIFEFCADVGRKLEDKIATLEDIILEARNARLDDLAEEILDRYFY